MKELKIVKKELEEKYKQKFKEIFLRFDNDLYTQYLIREAEDQYYLSHRHVCNFDLIYGYDSKFAELKCKFYLKTKGKKRDKDLTCCDDCPYMKTLYLDSEENIMYIE